MSLRSTLAIAPVLGVLALASAAPAGAGCGGCQAAVPYAYPAPVLYAQPVHSAPIYADYGYGYGYTSCGGCGSASYYGGYAIATQPRYVKQPIYIVNQGPYYSGPGVMVPTLSWSKGVDTGGYPYVDAYRGYYKGGAYVTRYDVGGYAAPVRYSTGYSYGPRYGHAPRYRTPVYGPRPYYHRGTVIRARAEYRPRPHR